MNRSNSFFTTLLFFVLLPNFAQAAHLSPQPQMFPSQALAQTQSLSFDTMQRNYGVFAGLFNLCQKQPQHADCGAPYDQARFNYEQARANHQVLQMLQSPEMVELPMPQSAQQELVGMLFDSGYLHYQDEEYSKGQVEQAMNRWLNQLGYPSAEKHGLLHFTVVKVQVLAEVGS